MVIIGGRVRAWRRDVEGSNLRDNVGVPRLLRQALSGAISISELRRSN